MIEIRVPKWGLTMEDAVVIRWLKAKGDQIQAGEELVELETDKVTGVVPSPVDGVLSEIIVGPDETVLVEALLGYIDEDS